jgi:hypothetical protein
MSSTVLAGVRSQSSAVNLSVLQQRDSSIIRVLFTAKHVVLYHLSAEQQWVRQETEGPLFVAQRRTSPYYQLVLLNRKSPVDWRQPLTPAMGNHLESNGNYLFVQVNNIVISLWCHEKTDCDKLLELLRQLCPISDQMPTADGTDQAPPQQQQQQLSAPIDQPKQAQQQQSQKQQRNKQPPADPQPPWQPIQPSIQQPKPTAAAISSSASTPPLATPPPPKSYASPYAPPPQVQYNVALPAPSPGQRQDYELQKRLSGFISSVLQADSQHTASYERERENAENIKRTKIKQYETEKKQQAESERAQRIGAGVPVSSSAQPAASVMSGIFPSIQKGDMVLGPYQFPSVSSNLAPPPSIPAASSPTALEPSELERNLAATKARKAARAAQQQQQQQPPPPYSVQQPSEYSPSFSSNGSGAPPPVSSLPLSLLFAASQAAAAQGAPPPPPMPVLAAVPSPQLQPAVAPYAPPPTNSPMNYTPASSSNPVAAPVSSPSAATSASTIHPLLAMLSINSNSQPLPPMPTMTSTPTPQSTLPAHSPYAARPSPIDAGASTPSAPVLLAPSHFLSIPTSSSTSNTSSNAALASPVNTASISPSATPRSAADFKAHLLWLINDPSTFDWLYRKHIANPQAHPFV